MIKKYEWVYKNICLCFSLNLDFEPIKAKRCFIVACTNRNFNDIYAAVKTLYDAGYRHYYICGTYFDMYEEALELISKPDDDIEIFAIGQKYYLYMEKDLALQAMLCEADGEDIFVLSDDRFYTTFMQHISDVINMNNKITFEDWKKFQKGYEFNYKGKDAIIVIGEKKVYAGFLNNVQEFNSYFEMNHQKLFGKEQFIDVWHKLKEELNKQK